MTPLNSVLFIWAVVALPQCNAEHKDLYWYLTKVKPSYKIVCKMCNTFLGMGNITFLQVVIV